MSRNLSWFELRANKLSKLRHVHGGVCFVNLNLTNDIRRGGKMFNPFSLGFNDLTAHYGASGADDQQQPFC